MEQLANNATSQLDGAITSGATSLTVDDGSVFPSSGDFRLLCGTEIMICTARSGNTLTVTRGQESTTAASHLDNAQIEHLYTKGSFEALLGEYEQVGVSASRPSTARKGTVYTASDLMNAQWMYDGTNWNLIKPLIVPYANRVNFSGWTALNHSTATFTDRNGINEIFINLQNNNAVRGYYKATSGSTPNSLTAYVPVQQYGEQSFTWYIGYRDSVSGRLLLMFHAGNTGGLWGVEQWNNENSWAGTYVNGAVTHNTPRFIRMSNDGTNLLSEVSIDNKNWTQVYSQAKATWLTNNQAQYGIFCFHSTSYPNATGYYFYLLGLKET